MSNLNSFSVYLINKDDYTQYKDLVVDGKKTNIEAMIQGLLKAKWLLLLEELFALMELYKRKILYE